MIGVLKGQAAAMWQLLHLALVTAFASTPVFAGVFSLSDLQWSLKNANGSIVIPGSVPSQAHLDLLRAGIITEPLLGINGMHRVGNSVKYR